MSYFSDIFCELLKIFNVFASTQRINALNDQLPYVIQDIIRI